MDQELQRGIVTQTDSQARYAAGVDNSPMAPTPLPLDRPTARQISINPLNHGFHVIVGCQAFACESIDALLHRLSVYLKAPAETEKKWMSGEWRM